MAFDLSIAQKNILLKNFCRYNVLNCTLYIYSIVFKPHKIVDQIQRQELSIHTIYTRCNYLEQFEYAS